MKKIILLMLFMTSGLWAEKSTKDYSAEAFIEEALRLSFTFKHSQLNVQQQHIAQKHQKVWSNPDFELGFDDRFDDKMEFSGFEFSQKLPNFNASKNSKGKNQALLERFFQIQKNSRLDAKYQAIMVYYSLYYAKSALKIVTNQINETNKLLAVANAREASGDISGVMTSRIKIAKAQLLSNKKQLQTEYEKINKQAQYLLQTKQSIHAISLLKLSLDFEPIDLESDAKILALKAHVKAQKYALESEKSKRYLLPELYINHSRAEDFTGGGIRFSLPLWDQNSANIEQSKINIQKSDLSLKQMQTEVENSRFEQKTLYKQASEQANYFQESVLKPTKKFYTTQTLLFKSGENSLLELLDAQALYFNAESRYNALQKQRDIYLLRTMQASSINLLKDIK